jgi:hypothetical protein
MSITSDRVVTSWSLLFVPATKTFEKFRLALRGAPESSIRATALLLTTDHKMALYVDDGVFLPMLNESDRDGEHHLRTLDHAESEKGLVPLLGEKYPASATTSDLAPV